MTDPPSHQTRSSADNHPPEDRGQSFQKLIDAVMKGNSRKVEPIIDKDPSLLIEQDKADGNTALHELVISSIKHAENTDNYMQVTCHACCTRERDVG